MSEQFFNGTSAHYRLFSARCNAEAVNDDRCVWSDDVMCLCVCVCAVQMSCICVCVCVAV